jgi:predicted TIM-barrel fold metal-dependent hydrolase
MSEVNDDRLYDTHAHLFTDDTQRYPIDTRGAKEGEEAVRRRLAENPIPPERLLQWWDESGVAAGAGVQYNTIYKADNSYVLDSSDRFPERISAVVMLPAANPNTPQTLLHMITHRRIVALRLFGFPDDTGAYPWLDSDAALHSWEAASRNNLHIVIMYVPSSESTAALGRIRALAERFPNTQITLDHCGWPSGGPIAPSPIGQYRSIPNVHFKVTTINFRRFDETNVDAARWVRDAADTFGAQRLMWGSDVGNTPENFQQMTARARNAASLLNAEERRAFLHDNGRALFERR